MNQEDARQDTLSAIGSRLAAIDGIKSTETTDDSKESLHGGGADVHPSLPDTADVQKKRRDTASPGQAKGEAKKEGSGGHVASQSSKQLPGSNKLEDQINLQHLVELMNIFYEADENGSDGLDIDEFKAAFGQILGKGKKDQQMAVMFMKIDTNCDGTVDWDEFCTYMLLEYQEKDVMEGEKLPLFPYPLKVLPNCHRDTITKIVPLPTPSRHGNKGGGAPSQLEGSDGRFVSVCKDGTVCFWKTSHSLQRMVHVESTRSRFTWVTDMVVMANINKIIMSFTDNTLAVYDITTFDLQQQVVGFRHCVLTLHYWYDLKEPDHAVLVFGDSGGGVGTCQFFTATSSLFPVRTNTACRNQDVPMVTFSELIHYSTKSMRATYLAGIHGDWVAKVLYCPSMELCMSCSNDSGCSLHLVDSHGRKDGSVIAVRKGISSFDYSKELNIIATGGLDRSVRLWNPYIPGKPTATMEGHATAIVHVALHATYGEVLSFSRDLELRVWDLRDQLCLQVCHRFQQLLPQPPSAFCLHPRTGALLVGTNQLGVLEPCRDEELKVSGRKDKTLSHEHPLTAALYNTQFNQVVSGCQGGVVSVWDLDTGEKTMQFSRCHGDMELTAMIFDPSGRRLITGGRDGSLKIWNFNNGACLNVLENRFTLEVTSLCFLKQQIIVGGWNQLLSAYSDTRDPDSSIPKYFGAGEHHEDILSIAGQEPNLLASASYDGDILLWNLDIERCVGRLNAGCQETRLPRPVFGCTGRRHLGLRGPAEVGKKGGERGREEQPGTEDREMKTDKDERAVEKLLFLKLREPSLTGGSLVACGAGGWVQFWNTSGGGLVGEFNVWDTRRHTLHHTKRSLHSVTAMHVNETETVLYTGNSLGYLQLWDIQDYCLHRSCSETTPTVVMTPPPLKLAWRSHVSSIVTIDVAEETNVIVTASTDCTVHLWSHKGCYIGTFGQRASWQIPPPPPDPQGPKTMHLIPPDLHRSSSFETIHTISGAVKSKWSLAKNLLRALMLRAGSDPPQLHEDRHLQPPSEDILGRCYERRTRVRRPIECPPLKQREGGIYSIYTTLTCPDLEEPAEICPPTCLRDHSGAGPRNSKEGEAVIVEWAESPARDHATHTEASLLQNVWRGAERRPATG